MAVATRPEQGHNDCIKSSDSSCSTWGNMEARHEGRIVRSRGRGRAAARSRILLSRLMIGGGFGTKTGLTHKSTTSSAAGLPEPRQALAQGFARVRAISAKVPSDRLPRRIDQRGHLGPLPGKVRSEVCCGFWSHLSESRSARSHPLHLTRRRHTDHGCLAPLALDN